MYQSFVLQIGHRK